MELLAKLQLAGIDISVPALSLLEGQKRPVSDQELQELCRSVIEKLARMTDAEFQATDFTVYEEVGHRGK